MKGSRGVSHAAVNAVLEDHGTGTRISALNAEE